MKRPAILGGPPAFATRVPFARPAAPPLDRVMHRVATSWDVGRLTNGPLVAELEATVCESRGVAHAVAVSNCTAGLILVLQALAPEGPVIVPSFTFSASAHAIVWNARAPVFAECDPLTLQLDMADASRRGAAAGVGAVLATHVFGAPCAPVAVEELGRQLDVPVVFDAAHAFGARHHGRPIGGFGAAEVFSLSPTKPVVAGEGGLVLTNDDAIAEHVRIGRNYGNPGDYDTRFPGLNARMSELHAATALESLVDLDENLGNRLALASAYRQALADVPGVRVQVVPDHDVSTYKDFTVVIGAEFGVDRARLLAALRAEGIDSRCYFSPPVHRQHAYRKWVTEDLPTTDAVAEAVISLPISGRLRGADAVTIAEVLAALQHHAAEVSALDHQ